MKSKDNTPPSKKPSKSKSSKVKGTTQKKSIAAPKESQNHNISSSIPFADKSRPILKLGQKIQVWGQPNGIKVLSNIACHYIRSLIKHVEADLILLKELRESDNEKWTSQILNESTESISKFIEALINYSAILPPNRSSRPNINKLDNLEIPYLNSTLKHLEAELCLLIELRITGDDYEDKVSSYIDNLLAELISYLIDLEVIE